jgi:DNA-binding MarR family transcriptional regulator/N-acetylglutamate synthase-like GNAT family acetyltransferase
MVTLADAELARRIEAVRRFSRFYTRQIGLLQEGLLQSPFSLSEARVVYELAHHERATATELGADLDLDAGYLSRILKSFRERGLIEKQPSELDARQSILCLTPQGQEAFALLNARSQTQIAALLNQLPLPDQERLVAAMGTVEELLGAGPERPAPYILRSHRPGDMGWVVQRHGALYFQEYGWDETFEALVAGITAEFIEKLEPARERCWIAERNGENLGSIFLVQKSDTVAKLRLFLVEPTARGAGIGKRLVAECINFARQAGYRKVVLWTQSVLLAARHIYAQAGFRLVESEPNHAFGYDLVSETWELEL